MHIGTILNSKKINNYDSGEYPKISDINTFRDYAPFFRQREINRFLRIFYLFPTEEKNERGAPVGIWYPRV